MTVVQFYGIIKRIHNDRWGVMIYTYISSNFMTLMILLILGAVMWINRKEQIPASNLFLAGIFMLLVLTVTESAETWLGNLDENVEGLSEIINARTVFSVINYILRPAIIMIEVFLLLPTRKLRLICALPAVINAGIYSTALFGSHIAFYISDGNGWHEGPLNFSVFLTQYIYIILLAVFSFVNFKQKNLKKVIIIIVIFIEAVIVAVCEITEFLTGYATTVTALCILAYYIYLSLIYQQEIKEMAVQKELEAAHSELMSLRNQIHPHFIYNTLNIIRSLIRIDSDMAVKCMDLFSGYLRSHIEAIKKKALISFDEELDNVRLYLSLVQIDYTRKVDVKYDIRITDFYLPPLSLEPLVENAVEHGLSKDGGIVTLHTFEEDNNIVISVSDNGTAVKPIEDNIHTGVGIENTRKRIEMQCGGRLEVNITDAGAVCSIIIPKETEGSNENTDSR